MSARRQRSARAVAMLLGCALVTGAVPAVGYAADAASTPAGAPAVNPEQTASEAAVASGRPVEVTEARTEYTTTVANPDGTYTLTQATTPQRVKTAEGSWRDIDITLEKRADGSVGPKAAMVDLSFSGGGQGKDLITLGNDEGTLSLRWPSALPEPRLSGPTATYPGVFEGVDLQLTATAVGYREVLVVHSAKAAANPQLNEVTLNAAGDGLRVVPGPGGGLRAVDDDGNTVFSGPAGQMWDSAGGDPGDTGTRTQLLRTAPQAGPTVPPGGSADPGTRAGDDAAHPGEGDAAAELPVKVTGEKVTITPDTKLLRGANTVYPVYIDPPMGLGRQERTVLSSDGDRFWDFDGDHGVGNCSVQGPYYCGSNYTNRMYFEFAPTSLPGKYVLDATFRAYETWSFSCDPKWVDLVRTDNISEATRWPGPKHLDLMNDQYVSAGRGTNCTPEQPDRWVEFHDNRSETDENLIATVRALADGKISRLTLMLKAKDEGDPAAWKRFDDNAELQIVYIAKPGVPGLRVASGDGGYWDCKGTATDPQIVTRLTPTFQATVQTLVKPRLVNERGSLRAFFHAQRRASDGSWVNTWSTSMPETGYDPDDTVENAQLPHGEDGLLYRVSALTQSHWTYGTKSGSLSSPYHSWCYFKIDVAAPKAPRITAGSPYTACTPTLCEGAGGPGVPGTFTFAPNAADSDVTTYRWYLVGQARAHESAGPIAKDVAVFPSLSGTVTLAVQAKDVNQRWGETAQFLFKVKPAEGEVGRWRFGDRPTDTTTVISKDTATEGLRHDATLYGGASWADQGRRGAGDYSLGLNSADPAKQQAYAATGSAAVNTSSSFTAAAWVYLTEGTTNRVALAAPGAQDAAFTVYYSYAKRRWAFNRGSQDKVDAVDIITFADPGESPLNVWTHVAGVFDTKGDTDKSNDTIQLFINGKPQGQPVTLAAVVPTYEPWLSVGGLQIGRTKGQGVYAQYFRGHIDEVAVWQRALGERELRQEAGLSGEDTPTVELVADWNAGAFTGTEIKDTSGYGRPSLKLSATGARAGEEALLLDGTSGHVSATGPVVDEKGSFTVTARARLDKAVFAGKPVGYRAMVFAQPTTVGSESSWALWAEKVADGVYLWRFGRTAVDATGTVTETASVPAQEPAAVDTWVQVTGVFDASEQTAVGYGKTRLYVGMFEQDPREKAEFTTPTQGTGALTAGKGSAAGTTGHHLPGALQDLRMWSGAMSADQVGALIG
ncbi:LamG-like jellyroll fold domain-containing protein [Streptomyces sp. NPDC006307]|uniref:LamG-like jellyroll fold domain-containing protein n=1 Tax=Streptomyces sp. NPDC006307 TaxID=3156748 RepID=UPI0033ACC504